jgi:ribosomal protein L32E
VFLRATCHHHARTRDTAWRRQQRSRRLFHLRGVHNPTIIDPKKIEALRLKAKALSGLNEFVVNSVKAEQLKSSFRENNLPSMGI